ncbi:MAG: 4Fe-4S dicluster domain-containing protein [Candidatus Helarchaeota archaeon]
MTDMKISIDEEFCKGTNSCGYCIMICPKGIFEKSSKMNKRGYLLPIVKNNDSCINCKKCELICPEMAISVEKNEEKK